MCQEEGVAGFDITFCGGDYGRHGYPTDEDVMLFVWGRFVITMSHNGRLAWLGLAWLEALCQVMATT